MRCNFHNFTLVCLNALAARTEITSECFIAVLPTISGMIIESTFESLENNFFLSLSSPNFLYSSFENIISVNYSFPLQTPLLIPLIRALFPHFNHRVPKIFLIQEVTFFPLFYSAPPSNAVA